ncbi:MAG: PDZ domain-containing protein [Tannerellaceae bacterium]|jgi:C-terminal processing protease CtpA/Prc|nr:PDZ domain-containing protein [Tannerellaceae bacterium]
MKINRQSIKYLLWAILLCSCTEKEVPEPDSSSDYSEYPENEWIEKTMRRYYLWEDEIPKKEKLDPEEEPESFFYSLLTEKDGKTRNKTHYYYSSINAKSSSTKSYQGEGYSYGFEFQYFQILNYADYEYALLALYVLPGSPAEKEGLKRGDWIVEINGKPVSGNVQTLLNALDTTSPEATITLGVTDDPRTSVKSSKTLQAATVEDNPVFLHKIITYGGKRIAYLVYNHFTSGPTDTTGDELFNNTLRDAFRQFKAEQPDEFILDLRYNGGGLVSCAQLMATMLAPQSALGDIFCKLTYNGKENSYQDRTIKLDKKYMEEGAGGANVDLKRLYVIVSSRTASASEAVINGLRAYIPVILVGEQTEGKNVGSVTFDDYDWELHPIVSRLSNKNDFSDYEDGFSPDLLCDEYKEIKTYYDLGDEREYMLRATLEYITGSGSASFRSSGQPSLIPLYNSLDRKKTNGVQLNR